ncbi:hypothetical protein GGX14DRAFT_637740 [Mycena pura]|uniref:Uncharacterized protein n=1 Tax=Mycena pura TaxID=153505 RepID=A0AAD6VAK2_9AGAR|nr:hypothetical protein GGX14DRAFT_637740 [Mycena pura]
MKRDRNVGMLMERTIKQSGRADGADGGLVDAGFGYEDSNICISGGSIIMLHSCNRNIMDEFMEAVHEHYTQASISRVKVHLMDTKRKAVQCFVRTSARSAFMMAGLRLRCVSYAPARKLWSARARRCRSPRVVHGREFLRARAGRGAARRGVPRRVGCARAAQANIRRRRDVLPAGCSRADAKCSFDPKAIAEHRPDERSLSAIPTRKEWSAIFVGWSWQSHRIHMASMAKRDRFLKRMVVKAEVRKLVIKIRQGDHRDDQGSAERQRMNLTSPRHKPEFFFEEGEGSVFSAEIQNP